MFGPALSDDLLRAICPAGKVCAKPHPFVPAASNYINMMRRGIFNIEWPKAHASDIISSLAILVYPANRTLTSHG